jgi:hypothetical protein
MSEGTRHGQRKIPTAPEPSRSEHAGAPAPPPKGVTEGTKRHPAEVTSDRLLDAVGRWHEKFTGAERDAIGVIRYALDEIAEGVR